MLSPGMSYPLSSKAFISAFTGVIHLFFSILPSDFLVKISSSNPRKDYETLLNEMRLFSEVLLEKPRIAAITNLEDKLT